MPFYVDWPKWLASAGVAAVVDASRGPRFSHTFLALQAAASGQGVALATSVLIGDALEAGRLVRPFDHELRGPYEYYLVCPEETAERHQIQAFREWILEQVHRCAQQVRVQIRKISRAAPGWTCAEFLWMPRRGRCNEACREDLNGCLQAFPVKRTHASCRLRAGTDHARASVLARPVHLVENASLS